MATVRVIPLNTRKSVGNCVTDAAPTPFIV